MGETELEMCPFCGFAVESPCDAPPPVICQTAHEVLLAQSAEMQAERRAFEAAAYARYQRMKAAGVPMSEDGDGTPEGLFWLQPNGEYGVRMWNAAWWGWKAAKGLV